MRGLGARIGWRHALIAVRGLGGCVRGLVLARSSVLCLVGLDLAASGVGLDCGGRLVGALGRIRDGVGRWIGWGDGRLLYLFSF